MVGCKVGAWDLPAMVFLHSLGGIRAMEVSVPGPDDGNEI